MSIAQLGLWKLLDLIVKLEEKTALQDNRAEFYFSDFAMQWV